MKGKRRFLVIVLFLCFTFILNIQAIYAKDIGKGVQITFLGHAAFKLVSPKGVIILVDPFLKNNPKTPDELKELEKADLILVTHGHADHLGDTVAIAQKTNAQVVAIAELAGYITKKGVNTAVRMNKGGSFITKGIRVTMVNAQHSSSVADGDQIIYAGEPVGFIIRFENGFTVYHAGDTAVFSDMKIISELYKPDMALLPIGSHFTMDPNEAAYACKLLSPKYVVPMHYGTWPVLTGTVEEFKKLMKNQQKIRVIVMTPGQTIQ